MFEMGSLLRRLAQDYDTIRWGSSAASRTSPSGSWNVSAIFNWVTKPSKAPQAKSAGVILVNARDWKRFELPDRRTSATNRLGPGGGFLPSNPVHQTTCLPQRGFPIWRKICCRIDRMRFYAASSLRVTRRTTAPYSVVAFLGGFSFLGFYFLPKWLMAPLFPLTPAFGPLFLALAGLRAMRRARAVSQDAALRPGRLFAATLISCALLFVPVAVLEFMLFGVLPYIGPFIALMALPFHLVCIGMLAAGLYALSKAEGDKPHAALLALPAVGGLLVGIALAVVRFEIVPRSHGIFLKAFAASGLPLRLPGKPLDPHGQKDIEETLGVEPRSYHEPIAAIGDDSLWLARRSKQSACSGYWIERKGFAPGGSDWRQCLPMNPGQIRNPTAMASDPNSGVFIVGFDVRAGNESWWLKRYDAQGVEDKSWDKSFPTATK